MESSQISVPNKKSRPWLLFVIGIPAVVIIYLAVAAVFIYTYDKSSPYSAKYGEAVELYHSVKLAEARKAFSEILDYEDSRKYYESIKSQPTCVTTTNSSGREFTTDYVYETDELGRLVREVRTSLTSTSEDRYYYGENGKPLRKESFEEYGNSVHEYFYDDSGNRIRIVMTDDDGDVSTFEESYDSQNRKICEVFTSSMDYSEVSRYDYDEKGNITDYVVTSSLIPGEEITDETVFQFDDRGRKIRQDSYTNSAYIQTVEYFYDEDDNVVKAVTSFSRGPSQTTYAEYEKTDNLTKVLFTNYDGEKYILEYEYDDDGNIVRYTQKKSDGTLISSIRYSGYVLYIDPDEIQVRNDK